MQYAQLGCYTAFFHGVRSKLRSHAKFESTSILQAGNKNTAYDACRQPEYASCWFAPKQNSSTSYTRKEVHGGQVRGLEDSAGCIDALKKGMASGSMMSMREFVFHIIHAQSRSMCLSWTWRSTRREDGSTRHRGLMTPRRTAKYRHQACAIYKAVWAASIVLFTLCRSCCGWKGGRAGRRWLGGCSSTRHEICFRTRASLSCRYSAGIGRAYDCESIFEWSIHARCKHVFCIWSTAAAERSHAFD